MAITPKDWMTHLNGHVMCAIDVETTGLDPDNDAIYQIAIIPLDAKLEIRTDVSPFDIWIKPELKVTESPEFGKLPYGSRDKIMKAIESGFDAFRAVELFENWLKNSLKLHENKRITPLGHNYAFDRDFLSRWLGPMSYNHYFDSRYRDSLLAGSYLNDRADFQAEAIPYTKGGLAQMCKAAGIHEDKENFHDAMFDCWMTARLYKALCKEYMA